MLMARLEAKIEANQEKLETSQEMKNRMGALISRMDTHQARTEST